MCWARSRPNCGARSPRSAEPRIAAPPAGLYQDHRWPWTRDDLHGPQATGTSDRPMTLACGGPWSLRREQCRAHFRSGHPGGTRSRRAPAKTAAAAARSVLGRASGFPRRFEAAAIVEKRPDRPAAVEQTVAGPVPSAVQGKVAESVIRAAPASRILLPTPHPLPRQPHDRGDDCLKQEFLSLLRIC